MRILDDEQFFRIFLFSNSFALLRQFISLKYSIEISNKYDEAEEYILSAGNRKQYDFLLVDFESADMYDSIRLLSFAAREFPEIKRAIVVNRKLSGEDETLIKETFNTDCIFNIYSTNDFYGFFKSVSPA